MRKGYSDSAHGQIHWRLEGSSGPAPDLYCLHPAPFSGLAFTAIMPHLAGDRRVIAPDYPGHGGSDALTVAPSVEGFAEAMAAVIDDVSGGEPVDLVGFHTGCLVALALAASVPSRIGRLVLIDMPYFDADTRQKFLDPAAQAPGFTAELESLSRAWEFGITKRIKSQPMARAFEMFVEQLRHGEGMNAAFAAARDYDVEQAAADTSAPVTVIATQSPLLEASQAGAAAIPGASLVERTDVSRAVLDEAASTIALEILKTLDHS
ncbi:alpha/beta fold hydrolase [Parasphingopyxis sp. CP4]|uniref:alpha/beta fold hydrolase n=1 Tax=Parasphingopyxis sp. CP4 TaxID=2724527 RepID=UPI0015A2E80A|nr:alpha/beta hydrolase [Parasphingopyxis sp. CP4]QLC23109.1 alpha/beta fold hydrolase [Parasphingopyxis sp. CP4]